MAALTSLLSVESVKIDQARSSIPDLEFATTDGIHYTRRLHGKERLSGVTTDYGEGLGQQMGLADVRLKQVLSREELAAHIKAAWIHLRFSAPWIAYRCKSLNSSEPNSFYFEYKKSSKPDEAEAWADETIVWRTESLSFREWEPMIKQNHWKTGSGHFGVEMHIAKGQEPNQWFFMPSCPHSTTDGKGLFSITDRFLRNFQEELQGGVLLYRNLPWGEEISRLVPNAALIVPNVGANDMLAAPQKPAEPVQFQRFLRKEREVAGPDEISHSIRLSPEQTKAVMVNCKKYRASLTAVVNSILVLAEIETSLQLAADASPDEYARIIESFRTSDVFTLGVNIADMRSHVYPKHAKALGGVTTGGSVNISFPTHHTMNHVRRCVQVGPDGKMTRNLSGHGFWDGLVPETQNGLKVGGRQPPHAYHVAAQMAEAVCPQIKRNPVSNQCVMASSLGSVERLGIFTPFSPLYVSEYPNSLFQIHDWIFGISSTNCPAMVAHTWEYNGRLMIHLQGSSRWQTEKSFKAYAEAVRARAEQISISSARATL
ncbi:hypothetical protein D9758_014708 [Tetrapyrgos nigripes]|uniref:Uncharacterized protein n=1 Tax=Tetrapyrgos nigripes TaxID=182062 RepID=A0A8H5FIL8_9AGAR|nr:hypothetical protein D9758_014708 [Tetrapyrgos nigripes]